MTSIPKNVTQNHAAGGFNLSAADLDRLLRESWIDRETADAAGIHRVDSAEGAAIIGRNGGSGDYAGLAFPYFLPGADMPRERRLRLDNPPLEQASDGSLKEKQKYLSPPGKGNMAYFPPGCDPAWLGDPSIPVVITEGEKKGLALWRLAWHGLGDAAEKPLFLPIALPGVWNWRGVKGKTGGPNGGRRDVKGPIADLDRIECKGRLFTICFDASSETNSSVEAARRTLAKELGARGATVKVATWEASRGKGIDDVLAKESPGAVLSILEGAEEETGKDGTSPAELADAILSTDHFARDGGRRLYVYRNGRYEPDGDEYVKMRVIELLDNLGFATKWSSRKANETVERITVISSQVWETPPLERINFRNGILNLATGNLEPHSPDFLSLVQIPVRYDPAAICPFWDKFVSEVFPGDSTELAWEIIGWLLTPNTDIQKAVLLHGDGGNGKSTFLNAVAGVIGEENAASVSLHSLEDDRFATSMLFGKLANICPDLPSEMLSNTSVFKAITGGDKVSAQRKFERQFEFRPFSRLVFSSNPLPRSTDSSDAFYRRWCVLPFTRAFKDDDPERVKPGVMSARLAAERPGAINKALLALRRLREQGDFTTTESTRTALSAFRSETDPLTGWLESNLREDPEGTVSRDDLYRQYRDHHREFGNKITLPTKNSFGRTITKMFPAVNRCQRTVSGKVQWSYVGISLTYGEDADYGR